jgi:four helix bundle protein
VKSGEQKSGSEGVNVKSPLKEKSYGFAIQIVRLARQLQRDHREYVLSKQVLRSGTAIGALVREAEFGQSRADFLSKMSIALKEANETEYWLSLLKDTEMISSDHFSEIHPLSQELIAMLVATVKTTKRVEP